MDEIERERRERRQRHDDETDEGLERFGEIFDVVCLLGDRR